MRRAMFAIRVVAVATFAGSARAPYGDAAVPGAAALAPQEAPPCQGPEHRQFDFWLGDWEVRVVETDRLAGTNEITSILGGCVLLESYSTPTGYQGQSFNAYDRATGMWHQTWVDNTGLVLKIAGALDEEGRMVLTGPGVDPQGNEIVNRIVWTPHEDGSVQQTWTTSTDEGETWTTVFDGIYRPRR